MAFWGLVLEPKKSYTQRGVEQPFHISMAALDLQNCDPNEPSVTVVCRKRDSDFILCSLSKKQGIFNVPLNLDFELGGDINFHVLGNSTVHLTGYIIEDAEFDDDSSLDEEEEEDEDELSTGLLKNTKKLLEASTKQKSNNVGQNPAKKPKLEEIVADDDDDDDDEDDDDESDLDISANLEADSDDDEDDDDDDDDDEDDEDDEDGEAAEALKKLQAAQKKPKQQGKQNAQPAKADQNQGKQGKKDKKEALKGQNSTSPNKATNGAQSNGVPKRVIKGGVQVEDLVVGTGPVAKDGKQVNVYYAGRLKSNNKQFDACRSGSGFRFRLGKAEVIKGWDVGITGMKVGGKRRLTIPAAMGYGSAGAGKTIPPNSVLVFDVELKSVQ